MSPFARKGPSSSAEWQKRVVRESGGTDLTILALPDGGDSHVVHALPAIPRLGANENGEPRVTFTVVLSRQPRPDHDSICDLVDHGLFAFTLTLSLPALADETLQPLFCTSAIFRVEEANENDTRVLAEERGAGAETSVALSMDAERDTALAIAAALDGEKSALQVRVTIRYRCAPSEERLHLIGSWSNVFDALAKRAGDTRRLSAADFRAGFDDLVASGAITISTASDAVANGDDAFEALRSLSSFILTADATGYALRNRPSERMPLDVKKVVVTTAERETEIVAPLEAVVGDSLDDFNRERFVHIVAPDSGNGATLSSVARLVRLNRRAATRAAGETKSMLALTGGRLSSLTFALAPDTTTAPMAHALIASDAGRPHLAAGALSAWVADDLVVGRIGDRQQPISLPVVENPSGNVFHDRINSSQLWYAPSFTLDRPAPADDPATSAFAFTFESKGTTGGPHPAPALEATLRFRLRSDHPDGSVPLGNLSVALEIPFRDAVSNAPSVQRFPAEIDSDDGKTITATLQLINEWVRICYSAVAYPDQQAQPARLRLAYAFRAYVPLPADVGAAIAGGKIAQTRIVDSARDFPAAAASPVFSIRDSTLRIGRNDLQLRRETRGVAMMASHAIAAPRFQETEVAAPALNAVVVHPRLELNASVAQLIATTRYGMQTIIREQAIDADLPCAQYGNFYRQKSAAGERSIGCQDAFRLGEIAPTQYEEIAELRASRYGVFKSLQQPGRFLVLPSAYRVSRYGPGEPPEKAFRPTAMIYAVLDANPANSRYYFSAALEADISAIERARLPKLVAAYTPFGSTPLFDYPTSPAVQAVASFAFAVPSAIAQPEVLQILDSFQVSVSTNMADALLLTGVIETSGLTGVATFKLADGSSLTSSLVVDTKIIGPTAGGPVTVALTTTDATVTNRTTVPVNVFNLVTWHGDGEKSLAVDRTLAARESVAVALPAPADRALAESGATSAAKLNQLGIFVDDVTTNVIFVNLVNYANHDLKQLSIETRLKNQSKTYVVDIAEGSHAAVDLTFDLTSYAAQQLIEYRITCVSTSGAANPTNWILWDLNSAGNVVSLTWELIASGA